MTSDVPIGEKQMRNWNFLRILAVCVLFSPILLQTGCGGDDAGSGDAETSPADDGTADVIDPSTDSTMNP